MFSAATVINVEHTPVTLHMRSMFMMVQTRKSFLCLPTMLEKLNDGKSVESL